ncbi:MAG: polymer-forming cytoskeletal protein [Clostridiales bacterium]|nr:polymer-forming cytoskeletal protein [Clostridiales bacterium]
MGFFSDLKEDLNQAVNELKPEGELDIAAADDELANESAINADTLSDMLDMVDAFSAENGLEIPGEELTDTAAMETEAGFTDDVLTEENTELSGDEALAPEMEVSDAVPDVQEMEVSYSEMEAQETEIPYSEVGTQEMEAPYSDVGTQETEITYSEMEAQETEASYAGTEAQETGTYDMGLAAESVEQGQPIEEETKPLWENEGEENNMEENMSMEMGIESKVVSDETAVVTEGMSITGDITSGGSLELIGNVMGNIEILGKLNITGGIQGNSKAAEIYAEGARINGEVISQGSVKIGQSSVVIGNITANSAVVAGAVKGDIDVHGPVILDTSAIVMGNIKSKSVQINNGAVIEGMCSQCYADVSPTSFFDEISKKGKKKDK